MSDGERSGYGESKFVKLFDGRPTPFPGIVASSTVYGEYGVGVSTIWVSRNTKAHIISVDSSREWIAETQRNMNSAAGDTSGRQTSLNWIDLGDIGSWGRPLSYDKRENFIHYCMAPWSKAIKPNVVLVDGRFRVACFLASLLNADAGTAIIFDDYVERRHYHVVQEFLSPSHASGSQAVFVVPEARDKRRIQEYLGRFLYVFD